MRYDSGRRGDLCLRHGQSLRLAEHGGAGLPGKFDSGLSQLDQRLADGGHNQLAPASDQALCVGNGFVLEGVRYALRVFSTDGQALTDPVALGPFFGDGHEVVSTNPLVYGTRHSAPRCLFDPDTGRFFVTAKRFHFDAASGTYQSTTGVELAVSRTGDPRGRWDVYALDATADGTNGSDAIAGCPCFPELPNLGVDEHGLYIGTTLVSIAALNGTSQQGIIASRIWAISKRALAGGSATHAVALTILAPGEPSTPFPVNPQPSTVPPGGQYDQQNGGTEYSVADCRLNSQIFVLALTHTGSLDDRSPSLVLSTVLQPTELTANPPAGNEQRDGTRPLAAWIQQQTGSTQRPPLEFPVNGPRCEQVILRPALGTALEGPHRPDRGAAHPSAAPGGKCHLAETLEVTAFPSVDNSRVRRLGACRRQT